MNTEATATLTANRRLAMTCRDDGGLLSIFTLVVWLGCLLVGFFGFVLPYARPHAAKMPEPMQVQILNVDLAPNVTPPSSVASPAQSESVPSDVPQPVMVADPTVAFAVAVEKPVTVSTYSGPVTTATTPNAPRLSVLRQGEGVQPDPVYPERARREGQEGTVVVRFTVGEDGRVIAADVISPSQWPLLNAAALYTIRNRWRLEPGPVRVFDKPYRIEIMKKL